MAYTRKHVYGSTGELSAGGGTAAQRERERTTKAVRDAFSRINERGGVLDLSYNTLVHDAEKEFGLAGTVYHLKKLDVTSCGLGPAGTAAVIASFRRGFAGPNLQSLVVAHNYRMGDEGVRTLMQGLVACAFAPQLQELGLGNTSCGDAGMEAIANNLSLLPALTRLGLECNTEVRERGWTALGDALQCCANCGVKTQGLSTACACCGDAEFRSPLASLTHLFAQGCTGMGCKGVEQLHVGLTKAPALEDLVRNCALACDVD
jgi:hypothetical protein